MAARKKKSKAVGKPLSAEARERTVRERKFIAHYAVFGNGAGAVRAAGYTTQFAREYAHELLSKPHIQAAVAKATEELGELHFDLARQAMEKYVLMMNGDPMSLFDANGLLLHPAQWSEHERALVAGFEVEEILTSPEDRDPIMTRITKVKFIDRKGVLDSINKILGRFVDRTQTQLLDKHGNPTDPYNGPANVTITVTGKPADA